MADRHIALETAAFLDSPEARGLRVPRELTKRLAEAFVGACYESLGKAPWLLDGEDVRSLMLRELPARLRKDDPAAPHAPAVIEALFAHLAATRVVTQAFEIHNALAASTAAFLELARGGALAGQVVARADPFVHGAAKLGRNDPCSCGSGKKYKKCHGKDE